MMRHVLVIGGGPAGLTVALRLSECGDAVTLLERQQKPSGRLAEGPPVLLGCDEATLSLVEQLGTGRRLSAAGPSLEFLLPDGRTVKLRRPPLPAPLHTLVGLATFRGLSPGDRWRLLNLLERVWEGEPALTEDLESWTAADWLVASGQAASARATIWTPLARFLAGGELPVISAASLVAPLARWLASSRQCARVMIADCGAEDFLLRPLRARLLRAGAMIRTDSPVVQILFDGDRVSGLQLADGTSLTAEWYVVAVPHRDLTPLLPERAVARFSYFQQITKLADTPALIVGLQLEHPLPAPRLCLLPGRPFHWLAASANRLSLVATGRPDLLDRPDEELRDLTRDQIETAYPGGTGLRAREWRITRMPHARLLPAPGTAALRPLPQSPSPNLLLAGDWTDTGRLATLESAIRSGEQCARRIAEEVDKHPAGA